MLGCYSTQIKLTDQSSLLESINLKNVTGQTRRNVWSSFTFGDYDGWCILLWILITSLRLTYYTVLLLRLDINGCRL